MVVDNTFLSPALQQPLLLGADVVVHSTTKYLGGHSDVVGGALVTADAEIAERAAFLRNATGAVPGPFESWLTLRGVRTLAVRMDRHCDSAAQVADATTTAARKRSVCPTIQAVSTPPPLPPVTNSRRVST